jgi:hypothetical protein
MKEINGFEKGLWGELVHERELLALNISYFQNDLHCDTEASRVPNACKAIGPLGPLGCSAPLKYLGTLKLPGPLETLY